MAVVAVENSLIPSYILTGDSMYSDIDVTPHVDPETGHFTIFVQIADGIFIYRGFHNIFTSFSKTTKISQLSGLSNSGMTKDIGGYIYHDNDKLKLPFEEVRRAQKFFADIYEKYKSESATVWYYNPVTHDWKCVFPIQINMSHAGITYVITGQGDNKNAKRATEIAEEKEEYRKALDDVEQEIAELITNGYFLFGTIHSHCDFGAFHSGVDDADEYGFDGVHITIGNVNSEPTYSQRFIGNQVELPIQDITNIVDMGEKTIEDLRNMSDLPNMLDTYGDRCFVSSKPSSGCVSYIYRNGQWMPKDSDDTQIGLFGIPLSNYDRWNRNREIDPVEYAELWDEQEENQTHFDIDDKFAHWYDEEFHQNQKVRFVLHGIKTVGKIVGECPIREKDIPKDKFHRPGKLYWIKSRSFPAKVLVESWDIDPITKKGDN